MDPLLEEALRKKALEGVSPFGPAGPPQPAPPVEAPPPPPAEPPPPPTDFRALLYQNLGDMTKQLGPDFDPNALREAQRQDIQTSAGRTLADSLSRAGALIRNKPVAETIAPNITSEAVQRLQQRRGDILGTAEAAQKLQGMLLQQSLYDPNSPMSRMYQDQIAKLDPDYVTKRYGGIEGLRSAPGFLIKQDLEARKELGGIQKTGAETANLTAEAMLKGVQAMSEREKNSPIPPDSLAQLRRSGLNVPPGTTWARLSDFAGPVQKGQEIALAGAKLEQELAAWKGNHPQQVSPLSAFKDPARAFNDRSQVEAGEHRDLESALTVSDQLLANYKAILNNKNANTWTGTDVGKLKAIHAQLKAAALKALGTNKFGEAPLKLIDELAPEAFGLTVAHAKDWVTGKERLDAQIDQARKSWKANLIANAGAHGIEVSPAVVSMPGLSDAARASGVQIPDFDASEGGAKAGTRASSESLGFAPGGEFEMQPNGKWKRTK